MKDFWKKTEKILLVLFLLLIPTQLGKHFWVSGSYVLGTRVDYLAPTLYLIDGVWLGLFLVKNYRNLGKIKIDFETAMVVGLVILNVIVAENRVVAIYRWLRISQAVWMLNYCWQDKETIKRYLMMIIPWWVGVEVFLGWMQVINGGSINGLWYWLGERRFNFNTIGVAQVSVNGEGFLRAYGTFSHPNSLAGFLAVAMIWWMNLKNKNLLWWIVFFSGTWGIIICGSRTVWVIWAVILMINIIRRAGKIWLLGGLILMIIFWLNLGGWDKDSFGKRMTLNKAAVEMVKENLWLGVGAGNFLVKLPKYQQNGPYWWQPVHNIPLLIISEIGILGVMEIGWILMKVTSYELRANIKKNWVVIGVILITGLVDHYWVTLPQNSWLLVVVLATMG